METNNDNIRKLLEMLDNPAAYSEEEIRDIINCDDDTREVYRLMVEAKRSSRRKLSCQPIDIDGKWAKFEREVIGKKTRSKKSLFWSIAVAASILLLTGIFLFAPNSKEPHQLQADAGQKTITKTEKLTAKTEVKTPMSEKRETNKVIIKDNKQQVQSIQHHETLLKVSERVIVGADSVGHLVFLTNNTDGRKLAERLLIHPDSASQSWQEKHRWKAHYHHEKTRIMMPKNMSFGMECEPSQSNEWMLYYDSIAHTLIYKKADNNIWQATRRAVYEEQKIDDENKTRWVPREHPEKCEGISVNTSSMPITAKQAQGLKAMWTEAVDCAKQKKALLRSDATYEFPLGELKVTAPNAKNPFVSFTNELTLAILTRNAIRKDSLLAEATLEKCLTDMKEAMKPVHFNYDSLAIIVNKQQVPESLCKQIRDKFRQYYHQQGLIVNSQTNWSAYSAKFYSGYDKNCPLLELTTVPDTLSNTYIHQHPDLQQSLRHVTGIVLDEHKEPIPDVWVGVYGEGAGAPTDSTGRFSFWLPRKYEKLYADCPNYKRVRDILITDDTIMIHLQHAK